MLTAFNSPEKACESRTPAIKLLTSSQTPEPITMSVGAAAHDRAKYLLTIKRNERSPSREIAAHNQRNVQIRFNAVRHNRDRLAPAGRLPQRLAGGFPLTIGAARQARLTREIRRAKTKGGRSRDPDPPEAPVIF